LAKYCILGPCRNYDTIKELTWTQKLSVFSTRSQKKIKNKKLEQTNATANLVQYRFKIQEGSPEGIRLTMEERIIL